MQYRQSRHAFFLQRLSDALWQDRSALFAYSLAFLLAILFIAHIYSLHFLLGDAQFFDQADPATNVTGWLFYAQDGWHFPLLHTDRLEHPEGVSIALTDSIPLAALLFKLAAPWLPPQFHYIGLWHAVAYLTQALAATFLIRSLGLRHALANIAAVGFAITWPALLFRVQHTALMTHALLLASLALYFLGTQNQRSNQAKIALIAINAIGLLIHPYFLAFCYPLLLAFLVDRAITEEGWKKQLPPLLASLAVIGIVGVIFGYFGRLGLVNGFGFFSMNLLAPFCGEKGQLFSCVADGTGGQYEGYNYFGAGLLLLMPFAAVMGWPDIKTIHRRYPALLSILILLTVYALSTHVYLGRHNILNYSLPQFFGSIAGSFRVSGRFFWVVGYAILFASLFAVLKKRSWLPALLVAIALPLQWHDVAPLRERNKQIASIPGVHDVTPWEKTMSEVDKIHIYPAFWCTLSPKTEMYLHFQRVASRYGKLIDTGYIARPSANLNCENNQRFFAADFQPRRLYVMPVDLLATPEKIPDGFKNAARQGSCGKWKDVILCHPGTRLDDWKNSELQVERITMLH